MHPCKKISPVTCTPIPLVLRGLVAVGTLGLADCQPNSSINDKTLSQGTKVEYDRGHLMSSPGFCTCVGT